MKDVAETIEQELLYLVDIPHSNPGVLSGEIKTWCRETLGRQLFSDDEDEPEEDNYREDGVWDYLMSAYMVFHFKHENDALLFKIAWGGK